MKNETREHLFNQAKKWVYEAGSVIKEKINDPLIINSKSNPDDLVTTMDKEIEQFFAYNIKSHYPNHLLLGEEGYGDDVTSLDGILWIIDPIDGTMNFVHQKKNFAISVALYFEGVGEIGIIYDVMSDTLYSAKRNKGAYKNSTKLPSLNKSLKFPESIIGINQRWLFNNKFADEKGLQHLVRQVRGTRSYGSAALEFAYVAEGSIDGYMSMRLSPWDVAAGIVIVNEVGGITTNVYGEDVNMLETNPIVVSNPRIQADLLKPFKVKKSDSSY